MRSTTLDLLLDNIGNLGNRIHALEVAFLDYTEENPKSSDQWVEERLRALEHQINQLPTKQEREWGEDPQDSLLLQYNSLTHKFNDLQRRFENIPELLQALESDHSVAVQRLESFYSKLEREDPWQKIAAMDQAIVEMLAKVNNFEWRLDNITQAQDAKITKLENVVAELGLALGNLTKELQDLKDAKIN